MTSIRHPEDVSSLPHTEPTGPIHTVQLEIGPVKAAVTCNCMTVSGMLIEALPSPLALNAVTGVAAGVVEELPQAEVATTTANTVSHFRVMSIHHCHAVSTRVELAAVLRTF